MDERPLSSLSNYSHFVAELLDRDSIEHSTVVVWSDSPFTGTTEGEVFFSKSYRLRLREEIDFASGLITAYGYEVYQENERLFWYDDFPHPEDPNLAPTFPHHKHIPPNIKRNRVPAPEMSFERPNLPVIIQEIERLINRKRRGSKVP